MFVASMASFTGSMEILAYMASKGAVAQPTNPLNNEWMGRELNVNAIAPGYIETELTSAIKDGGEKEKVILQKIPAGRWGTPVDLTGAIIHLCGRVEIISEEKHMLWTADILGVERGRVRIPNRTVELLLIHQNSYLIPRNVHNGRY